VVVSTAASPAEPAGDVKRFSNISDAITATQASNTSRMRAVLRRAGRGSADRAKAVSRAG
jgi:hypothetical protein